MVTRTPHFTTCCLCEAMCGVRIDVENDRVVAIRGDDEDAFSRGHVCPKAPALKDLHEDPDRLKQPMRRTATGWDPVSWEVALDEAARGLHQVQKQHGLDAVASYLGNPTVHNAGAMLFGPPFLKALRTHNRFSASSVDQLPHMLAAYLMFGHKLLMPVPDLDRTHYFLVLGGNPLASNGSLMTAPDMKRRLEAIKQRGRIVVVDPRRTETARFADEHVFVRPGTDVLFLLALLREVMAKGVRLQHLADVADGVEVLRELAEEWTPERIARATGIPADVTRRIASELLSAPNAVVYGRVGTSTQAFGSVCQWLITAINAITGNLDREGGAMFTQPAFDLINGAEAFTAGPGHFGRWKSRIRGLPEFGGELPVAALAEDILEEGEDRIRALFTSAGNPVLSTPNGRQLDRALETLDFMVSIDPYINETTRHANLILPPTSALERSHYDIAFHGHAIRNTAKFSLPVFQKAAGAWHDWEIYQALTERVLALRDGWSGARTVQNAMVKRLGPEGVIDLAIRFGPHGAGANPFKRGLSLRALRRAPHGVDLGALQTCLIGRLKTRDQRIQLAPPELVSDLERVRTTFPAPTAEVDTSLLLIGRRHLRDNNSWMHNVPKLMAGKSRCTLMLHPDDARTRGLTNGASVLVRSRVGEVTVPVEITDEMMVGVVSLPHGYGHARKGVRQRVAAEHAGVSVNDLTDDQAIDPITGNAAFSGVPVHVELAP